MNIDVTMEIINIQDFSKFCTLLNICVNTVCRHECAAYCLSENSIRVYNVNQFEKRIPVFVPGKTIITKVYDLLVISDLM